MDGEELIAHRFSTHSIGLASPGGLHEQLGKAAAKPTLWGRFKNALTQAVNPPETPAVCVPPGAWLVLKSIPLDLQRKWNTGQEETVYFVQTSAEVNTYRDALLFRDGRRVLLQDLREGMRIKVISMDGNFVGEEDPAVALGAG
jgi:hypothetical protein